MSRLWGPLYTLVDSQESSVDYYLDEFDSSGDKSFQFYESSLKKIGIEDANKNKTFITSLESTIKVLHAEYGVLQQIFIPFEEVNRITYISGPNGLYLEEENRSRLSTLIDRTKIFEKEKNKEPIQARLFMDRFIFPRDNITYPVFTYHTKDSSLLDNFNQHVSDIVESLFAEELQ